MADPTTPADRAPLITISPEAHAVAEGMAVDDRAEVHFVQYALQDALAELDAQRRALFEAEQHIARLMSDALELYEERNTLHDSLNHMTHLACGVGMAGGSPQSGEWESAIELAQALLCGKKAQG